MKKYLVVNHYDGFDMEEADTLKEAQKIGDMMALSDEGYNVECSNDIRIYECKRTIDITIAEKKPVNISEDSDENWPWGSDVDEVWKHEWIKPRF